MREPQEIARRCSGSSCQYDGRKQGGKRIAAQTSEFQKVNNFRVRFEFGHVVLYLALEVKIKKLGYIQQRLHN
jgi:hypothetical protein